MIFTGKTLLILNKDRLFMRKYTGAMRSGRYGEHAWADEDDYYDDHMLVERCGGQRPRSRDAKLQVKAADTDVITGSKSTGILVDETHEFAKKTNAAAIFVEIRGALAARPDGFMIQITTQSKAGSVLTQLWRS